MNRPRALLLPLLALSLLLAVRLKRQGRSTPHPAGGTVRRRERRGPGAAERRSLLMSTLESPPLAGEGLTYDAAFKAQYRRRILPGFREEFGAPPRPPPPPHEPYALGDAVREADAFETTFAVFVYDPPGDRFYGLYSDGHAWRQSNDKLFLAMNNLAYLLRRLFPERFTPSSPELVLAIASGDYPQVRLSGLPRPSSGAAAPVLMFGSAFRDEGLYPNLVAMPMPEEHHLLCHHQWASEGTVCQKLRPNAHAHGNLVGLEFGEENGLGWDDLIPQLVWRGSDFCYLPTLTRPRHIQPHGYKSRPGEENASEAAVKALRDNYDRLSPRWKGVTLSGEAALEAAGTDGGLPWADIKFLRSVRRDNVQIYLEGNTTRTIRGGGGVPEEGLVKYDGTGISTGEHLPPSELVRYKYHVDLGGGGGTTWSGTVQKLAMPGLLFHHVTPTKDYIHDRLVPWRHYVPVSHDLRDLRSKVRWAELNPRKARWMSEQASAFARRLGLEAGLEDVFREDLVEPLRRAIDAYRPVGTTHPPGTTWRDVLGAVPGGDKMKPIAECGGTSGSCHPLDAYREEVSQNQYGMYRSS